MLDGTPSRIVVFLPNWVGDVVMATPALRALRERLPGAHIAHAGRRIALETLAPDRWADETIEDPTALTSRTAGFLRLASRLRRGNYEAAVLLPNSFRTAALARMGGVRRVVGYSRDARGWMLTQKLEPPRDEGGHLRPISAIDYYLDLVRLLGLHGRGPLSRRMALHISATDRQAADALLDEADVTGERPVVMLNPGASFGPSKMWDPNRYAQVADRLMDERGVQIIINAAPSERAIAAEVEQAMQRTPAVSFAERDNTLGLVKGLLGRCDLVITNDTGARHLAAAMGLGVVTLFGSTDPRWAQIDYRRERIIRVELPCSPCQQKTCPQPAGPLYHACMAAITPEMVLLAALELLDRPVRAEALR